MSDRYQRTLERRILAGMAPHMEVLLHHYAFGKPTHKYVAPAPAPPARTRAIVADADRGAARDVRAIGQNARETGGCRGEVGGAARVASYVPTVSSRNGEPSSFAVSPRAWSAKMRAAEPVNRNETVGCRV